MDHLRQRVAEMLSKRERVTLGTCGPAGPQVSVVPCRAAGAVLYLLLPRFSDHLFNLEQREEVVAITPEWELRGNARALAGSPEALGNWGETGCRWEVVVEIQPARLQVFATDGWSYVETIDIEP